MEPLIYTIGGMVIGALATYYARPFSWGKFALVVLAVVVAEVALIIFVDQLPCFLGVPNCD